MHLLLGQRPVRQQRLQCAFAQRRVRHVARQDRQPHAGTRGGQQRRQVVAAQRAAHRHRGAVAVAGAEVPAVVALHAAVHQGRVLRDLGRRLRRAVRGHVGGGGHQHPGVGAQVARAQRGIGQPAHAHGQVHALLDQVHVAVLEAQVHLQLRVLLHEAQHQRRQHAPAEGHAGADAQAALHAALHQRGQAVGLFELAGDQLALVVVGRAHLGGRDPARAAVQQPRAEPAFQRRDVLGGGGLGDAQVGAGLAEAAGLDDADEETQADHGVHAGTVAAAVRHSSRE